MRRGNTVAVNPALKRRAKINCRAAADLCKGFRYQLRGFDLLMPQTYVPVVTPLGELHGRDAIFLDDISTSRRELTLKGEINGRLLSAPQDKYIGYTLTFTGVMAFSKIELEVCTDSAISSFDEILDSGWIRTIRNSVEQDVLNCNQLRHFFVQTYDDVFNVVCQNYELVI